LFNRSSRLRQAQPDNLSVIGRNDEAIPYAGIVHLYNLANRFPQENRHNDEHLMFCHNELVEVLPGIRSFVHQGFDRLSLTAPSVIARRNDEAIPRSVTLSLSKCCSAFVQPFIKASTGSA
jgi:hypothetical protein